MVIDMGLHQNSGKLLNTGGLTKEEVEFRRKLYWSCYFWDKYMISRPRECND